MKFGHLERIDEVDFSLPAMSSSLKKIATVSFEDLSFHIGAPVWADKNYLGVLFPSGTKQKDFLLAYSKQFNSIEVNATRFGTPKKEVINRWADTVDKGFKFSLKVPQVITHRKDINDLKSRLYFDQFLLAIDNLGDYSGLSFAVMANYFKASDFDKLVSFIENVPKGFPLSIEFRDSSWFSPSVMNEWEQLFCENSISTVITDTPGRRDVAHCRVSSEHLFVRYVGDFNHPSDLVRINHWLDKINESLLFGIKHVWFYVHQPGDQRGKIVDFFNAFISQLKAEKKVKIPLIKDYRQPELF